MSSLVMPQEPISLAVAFTPPKAALVEADPLARPASHAGVDALYEASRLTPAARDAAHEALLGPRNWLVWTDRSLLALGVALVVSGIVFMFAYNWADLPGWGKLAIAQGLVWGFAVAAWNCNIERLLGQTLLTASAMMVGVLIAVFGQVYQTGADAWTGFALWAVLILPWVLVGRFQPLWLLWLVVVNVSLITFWWQVVMPQGMFRGGSLLDWMRPAWLASTIAVLNVSVYSLGEWAAAKGWEFVQPRWPRTIVWCFIAVTLTAPMLIYTVQFIEGHSADDYIAPFTPGGMVNVLLYAVAMIGGYLYARHRSHDIAGLGIVLVSALSIVLTALACFLFMRRYDASGYFPHSPHWEAAKFLLYGVCVCGGFGSLAYWLRRIALEMAEETTPVLPVAAIAVEPVEMAVTATMEEKVDAEKEQKEASLGQAGGPPYVSWYRLLAIWSSLGASNDQLAAAAAEQGRLEAAGHMEPWYYHLLLGVGAWIAACFAFPWIALFLLPFGERGGPAMAMVYGIPLIAGGIFLRRAASSTFSQQFALITSIVGHGLLLGGLAWLLAPHGIFGSIELFLVVALAVVATTYFLFDDFVHRVIAAAAGLLFLNGLFLSQFRFAGTPWQIEAILTTLLGIELAIFAGLSLHRWLPPLARPAFYSLVLHIGFLIVVVTVIHDSRDTQSDWPVVWAIALGLGVTAIGLLMQGMRHWSEPATLAVVACLGLAAVGTPELLGFSVGKLHWWEFLAGSSIAGLLLAAWLVVVGQARGDAFLTLLGLAIIPLAIVFYYYSLEISLLAKAYVLLGTGAVLLAARSLTLLRAPTWEIAA